MAGKYKTMTLIEEAELERLRQKQLKEYNPSLKSMVGVQEQIEKLLSEPDLDDEKKYKILCFLQEKFGYLYKVFKNAPIPGNIPPAVVVPPIVAAEDAERPQNENNDDDDEAGESEENPPPHVVNAPDPNIVKTENVQPAFPKIEIPAQFGKKFEAFREFIIQNKKHINVGAKGELVIDGQIIPNSSFADLIRSFYIRNYTTNLIGLPNLFTKLRELNFDPELVSHKDAKSALHHLQAHSSQKGKGLGPPGKKPKILRLFR